MSWAKKVPFPHGEIVIHRIAESSDFGESFTQELKDREEKVVEKKIDENKKAAGL